MTVIEKVMRKMIEREYGVHVRRSGDHWVAEFPKGFTLKTLTLPELRARLEIYREAGAI